MKKCDDGEISNYTIAHEDRGSIVFLKVLPTNQTPKLDYLKVCNETWNYAVYILTTTTSTVHIRGLRKQIGLFKEFRKNGAVRRGR